MRVGTVLYNKDTVPKKLNRMLVSTEFIIYEENQLIRKQATKLENPDCVKWHEWTSKSESDSDFMCVRPL